MRVARRVESEPRPAAGGPRPARASFASVGRSWSVAGRAALTAAGGDTRLVAREIRPVC